jgi:hypothetical protein
MPYSHAEIKSFQGLYLQQNSFTVPDGALEQAENCVITYDGVITKRRGFFTFLTPGGLNVLNALFLYQNTLIAVYNSMIQWVSSLGVGTTLSGEPVAVTGTRVSRSVQANDNLYFTTDNGVMKIEAFNSIVYKAGIPPGLDLTGKFAAADGPIRADTQVGYRIVFGRRDANKNLLLGAPSDILVLTNRIVENSSYTSAGAGPYTITVTTASPHNLSTGMVLTFSDATNAAAEGSYAITVTGALTFTYSVTANPVSGDLDYEATRQVNLQFSVPEDVNSTEYFYQVYRTTQSSGAAVPPSADFKLIIEQALTAGQIADNVVFVTDDVLVIFEGAELYTNPNSREGELQANDRPPLVDDVTLFKDHVFYANATTRQQLTFDVVSTDTSFINNNNWIELKQGAVTRRYVARTGVGNSTVASESVSGTTTITVTYTAHGLVNGDTILVSNVVGTVAETSYVISGVAANTFDFTAGVGEAATSLDFQGVKNAANQYIFTLLAPGASPATGIDTTARAIVKAVDRDPDATFYARYLSGITDIPGKMYFASETFTTNPIQVRAETTQVGQAFNPELPAAFGTTVQSVQDVLRNIVFSSKVGEPEAVPATNQIVVGSRNKAIQRIFALRDSVIVIKEDGVFRIDGDAVTNFTATILDGTVLCVSPSSAALINNQVIFLSNQGVCLVSSTSVQIISRKIEAPIAAVVGKPELLANTAGVAYESERLYLLTTLAPNTTTASVVYCYNTLTDSWTTWDTYFKNGVVGPSDKLFLISVTNRLLKERKEQNKLDYTGESSTATAISISSDKLSGLFNFGSVTPQPGDVIVYQNIITRIETATQVGSNYTCTFESVTNIIDASTVVLYKRFKSTIKLSPFTAGATNRSKQFCQLQIHTKEASISTLDISYSNDTFGSSEFTTWKQNTVALQGGWGQLPWGFFAWGLEQGINLTYSTQPAPIVRTYIPMFAQRSTFIQPILEHNAGAEPLNIQSIGFQLRGYGERVSR